MKRKLLISLLATLFSGSFFGQKGIVDTIYWENGNYSLTNEIVKANLVLKNGKKQKIDKIFSIDSYNNKIEYLFEGTLHDLKISNLEKITPQKPHNYAIYFDINLKPFVKMEHSAIYNYEYENFKYYSGSNISSEKSKPEIKISEPVKPAVDQLKKDTVPTAKPSQTKLDTVSAASVKPSALPNDYIIYSDGRMLRVKILLIEEETISYRRADLLDGPLYTIRCTASGTGVNAKITNLNNSVTVDFRK